MLIIGHRGAPAHAPENTLRSFRTALAMGCNALEFDVQQCASGEMVVIHDRELSRTTSGSGAVAAHDAPTLKKLNAGEGETIPLLSEVL
jgi:glycerophosphoryl diester phosphodiesterase